MLPVTVSFRRPNQSSTKFRCNSSFFTIIFHHRSVIVSSTTFSASFLSLFLISILLPFSSSFLVKIWVQYNGMSMAFSGQARFSAEFNSEAIGDATGETVLVTLPPRVVMGKSVHVRISRAAYEAGLASCQTHLHGRLTLQKGDTPVTTQAMKLKLSKLWPHLQNWSLTPLGKGFFEFNFNSIDDMKRIWALGNVTSNLVYWGFIVDLRTLLLKLKHKPMHRYGSDSWIYLKNIGRNKHYLK